MAASKEPANPQEIVPTRPTSLLNDQHVRYIVGLDQQTTSLEYWVTEHLRVSGVYWGLTALALLGREDALKRDDVIAFLRTCRHPSGGYGGNVDLDAHLLYTLSAVQVLATYDALDQVDTDRIVAFVAALQQPDGSFTGDSWGEVDTRFSYCALSCLSLLNRLDAVDVPKAVEFIVRCRNFDGGFGSRPGAESHAAQVFCCVGALAIVDALQHVDADLLGWWLCERQLANGGLNGRPEKLEDDTETGGISDRPDNYVDVYHTLFGIAGLSLLGYPGLQAVNPVYCMRQDTIERLKLGRYRRL